MWVGGRWLGKRRLRRRLLCRRGARPGGVGGWVGGWAVARKASASAPFGGGYCVVIVAVMVQAGWRGGGAPLRMRRHAVPGIFSPPVRWGAPSGSRLLSVVTDVVVRAPHSVCATLSSCLSTCQVGRSEWLLALCAEHEALAKRVAIERAAEATTLRHTAAVEMTVWHIRIGSPNNEE